MFLYWADSPSHSGTKITQETVFAKTTNVYAVWDYTVTSGESNVAVNGDVTVDKNGDATGTGPASVDTTDANGNKTSVTVPDGDTFKVDGDNGTVSVTGDKDTTIAKPNGDTVTASGKPVSVDKDGKITVTDGDAVVKSKDGSETDLSGNSTVNPNGTASSDHAIVEKGTDGKTKIIVPGADGSATTDGSSADDVTVQPKGSSSVDPDGTVHTGAPGSTVILPTNPAKTVEINGPSEVDPNGTVHVPEGSSVTADGVTAQGPVVVTPDGTVSSDKPMVEKDTDGNTRIIVPGADGKATIDASSPDDVIIQPKGSSTVDADGTVHTGAPGSTVILPTDPKTTVEVSGPSQVTSDGTVHVPEGSSVTVNGVTTKGPLVIQPNGTVKDAVADPKYDRSSGTFTDKASVKISVDTEGAVIHYTTDGSIPTSESSVYSKELTVNTSTVFKAIAVKSGLANSSVVTLTLVKESSGGSAGMGGGSAGGGITVPVSSNDGKTSVSATVKDDTAAITMTDEQLQAITGGTAAVGTVTVDVTSLDVKAVTVPETVVSATNNAAGTAGMEVMLPQGSVTLDKDAVSAVNGKGDIRISVEPVDSAKLTTSQKEELGTKINAVEVRDVNVYVNDVLTHNFNGGKITVTVPYTLKTGETADSITVWYMTDDGTITDLSSVYQNSSVTFTTDHLSRYMVVSFPFKDVPASQWYYGNVAYTYMNGLYQGTSKTTFAPESGMTRGMLAVVLWRAAGSPSAKNSGFRDVNAGAYYAKAVAWAAANNIVKGYSSTKFAPDTLVTREQLAAILYRYAKAKGYDVSVGENTNILSYEDAFSVSEYAIPALQWAVGAELVQGDANRLMPSGTATRAQVAAVLQRMLQKVAK